MAAPSAACRGPDGTSALHAPIRATPETRSVRRITLPDEWGRRSRANTTRFTIADGVRRPHNDVGVLPLPQCVSLLSTGAGKAWLPHSLTGQRRCVVVVDDGTVAGLVGCAPFMITRLSTSLLYAPTETDSPSSVAPRHDQNEDHKVG